LRAWLTRRRTQQWRLSERRMGRWRSVIHPCVHGTMVEPTRRWDVVQGHPMRVGDDGRRCSGPETMGWKGPDTGTPCTYETIGLRALSYSAGFPMHVRDDGPRRSAPPCVQGNDGHLLNAPPRITHARTRQWLNAHGTMSTRANRIKLKKMNPSTMPPRWRCLADAYGGVSRLASALGIGRATLHRWAHGRSMPAALVRTAVNRLARERKVAAPFPRTDRADERGA
jgi:hypothetical protein